MAFYYGTTTTANTIPPDVEWVNLSTLPGIFVEPKYPEEDKSPEVGRLHLLLDLMAHGTSDEPRERWEIPGETARGEIPALPLTDSWCRAPPQ